MIAVQNGILPALLKEDEAELLAAWKAELIGASRSGGVIADAAAQAQCEELLSLLREATQTGNLSDIGRQEWSRVREMLGRVSRSRALQGFTVTETATFVFSLKKPLFSVLRRRLRAEPDDLVEETWAANLLLDQLGLYTTEVHQKARDEVITRQRQDLLELSTPVVTLWEGILVLPIIGTLDSSRTQSMMEALLESIAASGTAVAIIDITGVPTVDTLTAQNLLKTVTAARLMGAECIISGIRPQIAQTIVHLGVDLGDIITKASLADAFILALKRRGASIVRNAARQ